MNGFGRDIAWDGCGERPRDDIYITVFIWRSINGAGIFIYFIYLWIGIEIKEVNYKPSLLTNRDRYIRQERESSFSTVMIF